MKQIPMSEMKRCWDWKLVAGDDLLAFKAAVWKGLLVLLDRKVVFFPPDAKIFSMSIGKAEDGAKWVGCELSWKEQSLFIDAWLTLSRKMTLEIRNGYLILYTSMMKDNLCDVCRAPSSSWCDLFPKKDGKDLPIINACIDCRDRYRRACPAGGVGIMEWGWQHMVYDYDLFDARFPKLDAKVYEGFDLAEVA